MVDLYGSGFTEKEVLDYIPIVYSNTINSMQLICSQSNIFGENKEEFRTAPHLESFKDHVIGLEAETPLTPEIATAIKALWADPAIRRTFAHRALFQVADSADYFFDNIDKFLRPDFRPNKLDMLKTRVRTTGILETAFTIEDIKFKIFDVGGQRNERKKWIHCFENVAAVIFVAAISEYDQVLYEDSTTNRVVEALNLFEEICNSRWFNQSAMILFLNKRDLFEEKIKRVPLNVCFNDYKGTNEYEESWKFVAKKFIKKRADENKQIYTHVTCATDDKNVLVVFLSVKETILRKGLVRSGMLL